MLVLWLVGLEAPWRVSPSSADLTWSSLPHQMAGGKPFALGGWGGPQSLKSSSSDLGSGQGWAQQSSQRAQPQRWAVMVEGLAPPSASWGGRAHPQATLLPSPLPTPPGPADAAHPVHFHRRMILTDPVARGCLSGSAPFLPPLLGNAPPPPPWAWSPQGACWPQHPGLVAAHQSLCSWGTLPQGRRRFLSVLSANFLVPPCPAPTAQGRPRGPSQRLLRPCDSSFLDGDGDVAA